MILIPSLMMRGRLQYLRSIMKNFILTGLLLLTTSCGYHFQGGGSILPPEIKTIAIPVAENNTTELSMGERFTEALRSRFDRYGVVKIVDDETAADAVLVAKVVDLDSKVSSVTSNTDIETENDLVLTVAVELKKKNGQLLYKNSNLSISDNVAGVKDLVVTSSSDFAQGDLGSGALSDLGSNAGDREVQRGQEDQIVEVLLEEAARRIYLDAVAADF